MASIDEDTHADTARPAQIEKAVHGGAGGAAGVENIIDQNEILVVDEEWNFRGLDHGLRSDGGKIVAIEGDIERADGHVDMREALDRFGEALREWHAAATYADQREIRCAAALFHDFMGQTLEGAIDFFGGEELSFLDDAHREAIVTQGARFREAGQCEGPW